MKTLLTAIAAASLVAGARAQCTNLAVPGLNGCGNFTPFGIPTIMCAGAPTVGNAAFSVTGNTPCQTSIPVLLIGPCLPAPIQITGPFGAGGFCGPSMAPCLQFIGLPFYVAVVGAVLAPPNLWTFALPIPNDPTLQGATVCIQQVNVCTIATTTSQCIGASQGISVTVL
jgi:hypothetical protein